MGELIELKPRGQKRIGPVEILLPGSKSIYNRLLVMSSLSDGQINILGSSSSEDSQHLKKALQSSGTKLWMGEGGTALRFGLAWASIVPGVRILDGSARLRERPIEDLVDALKVLGGELEYIEDKGRLPIRVTGSRIRGGTVEFKNNLSSQFISALLMIAPYTEEGVKISLPKNQVSLPYIEMTIGLMKRAGAEVDRSLNTIHAQTGGYRRSNIEVEKDWSSASYFYLWKVFNPDLDIVLSDLREESFQGDAAIVNLFTRFGVSTQFTQTGAKLVSCVPSFPDYMDFLEIPDMAQSFAVAAAGLNLPLQLSGLSTLRVKETDRITALQNELEKFGVNSKANQDMLEIFSHNGLNKEALLKTYRDHRMAMAFAPLVSKMDNLQIEDPDVVAKSFPHYWEEVQKLGIDTIRT